MSQSLASRLGRFLDGKVAVLGFGNRLWRDDGVGSRIAEALGACPELLAVDGGMAPENHFEAVVTGDPDSILLIDAADFGGEPGEARLFDPDELSGAALSTHAGSPRMLAAYLTGRSGARVALLAIQPGATGQGDTLSPPVQRAAHNLQQIIPALCRASCSGTSDHLS